MSTKVVEIKTLKVGKYIVLGGEASKITSLLLHPQVNMVLLKLD